MKCVNCKSKPECERGRPKSANKHGSSGNPARSSSEGRFNEFKEKNATASEATIAAAVATRVKSAVKKYLLNTMTGLCHR